jgi:hypothetical protein
MECRIKKTAGLLTQVPAENPKKPNEKLLTRWLHVDLIGAPLIFYTPNTNYFTNFYHHAFQISLCELTAFESGYFAVEGD